MFLIFSASADNYITNKIISTSVSASDANVGQASTLDLFKIYDETPFTGFTGSYSAPTEISRLLVKFNLSDVSASLAKNASLDNFKARLRLYDINGSQIAPDKFNVAVFPLSKSFDEGRGSDIYGFNDLDHSNWMTASYTDSAYDQWHIQGASSLGYLDSEDIDIIGSGSIAGTNKNFVATQYFTNGHEDLDVDVTTSVSASIAGFMADKGFLIAFSGSEETDSKTRFVKRFASRHARNEYLRPKLLIEYNDIVNDQRNSMYFNTTGSIFLTNKVRGVGAFLLSGSNEIPLTGSDSLYVVIHSGSFALTASAGIYAPAGIDKTGIYSASFAVDRFSSSEISSGQSLYTHVVKSGSLKMFERWTDLNTTYVYHTGSFTIKSSDRSNAEPKKNFVVRIKNLAQEYRKNETHRIDLHIRDDAAIYKPVRKNYGLKSLRFENAYYRIRDVRTGNIIIPFTKENNATKISNDTEGMYFSFSTKNWPSGRSYTIDVMVITDGAESIYETVGTFKVV